MVATARKSVITNVPPSFLTKSSKSVRAWLASKRDDDNVEDGLWRINNTLYDLTDFVRLHPGGADWIALTKGHDITEAFFTHHLRPHIVEPFLKKYRVRDTNRPRNVKLTFHENGFYMTLRRRVIEKLPQIQQQTKVWTNQLVDGLFLLTMITAILSQRYQSTMIAILSSLLFTWTGVCGHNYLHRRDNFRMYYLNLLFMNYRDWRVSHVLSHHLYPNSLLDVEMVYLEPFFVWLPFKDAKNWMQRYGSYVYAPIMYALLYPFGYLAKIVSSIFKENLLRWDDLIPFIVPLAMYLFGGDHSLGQALTMFSIIMMSSGVAFSIIAINAGHHHPEIYHDGDPMREDYDWGIFSVDTIMDRQEIRGNALLTVCNFGDHSLHHLFPTLDHGLLPTLYEDFFKTLLEFEAECQFYPWFFETIKGQFKQLARIEPQKLNSHQKFLLKHGKKSS